VFDFIGIIRDLLIWRN